MIRMDITGNLTREPELREVNSPSGVARVCDFTVAAENREAKIKETHFIRVHCWNRLGETCAQYLRKGSKVYVSGTASCHIYTARDGQARAQIEINASQIEFLSSYGSAEIATAAQPAEAMAQGYNAASAYDAYVGTANEAGNGAGNGAGADYSGFQQVDVKLPF